MVLQEDETYINEARIDDDKIDTPRYTRNNKTTYTDHCAIIAEMNWAQANIDNSRVCHMRIDENALLNICRKTSGKVLTEIAQKAGSIDKKYLEWQNKVTQIIESSKSRVKIKYNYKLKCERKIKILKRNIKKKKIDMKRKVQHISTLNKIIEEEVKKEMREK